MLFNFLALFFGALTQLFAILTFTRINDNLIATIIIILHYLFLIVLSVLIFKLKIFSFLLLSNTEISFILENGITFDIWKINFELIFYFAPLLIYLNLKGSINEKNYSLSP